jgi:hypothetical protein
MSARRLLIVAVLFGVVTRIAQYGANTSIWHDEAFVALNVRHIPLAALLGPLDWHEPSPPGFLLLEKVAVAVGGESEWSLRAVPLLASLLALVAFARLARRACLSPAGAALAVLLMAASDQLIAGAALVKHFGLDLLATVLLVDSARRAIRTPTAAALADWGAVAAVSPWVSYASVFVVGGTAVALAPAAWRGTPSVRRAALGVGGALLLSAAVLSAAVLAQRGGEVVRFWADAFPPIDGGGPALASWLVRALVGLFDVQWRPLGGLLLLPVALVLPVYGRRRRLLLTLLWLPVGLALAASALRWWPFGGNQHAAFAAPAVLLLAGDGLVVAGRRLAARRRSLAVAAALVLLAPGLFKTLRHVAAPRRRHELRPVIAAAQAAQRPDDRWAVFDPATFAFYTGIDTRGVPPDLDAPARLWVVTPTSSRGALHPEVARVVEALRAARPRLAAYAAPGAAAYLFGPRAPAPPAGRPAATGRPG